MPRRMANLSFREKRGPYFSPCKTRTFVHVELVARPEPTSAALAVVRSSTVPRSSYRLSPPGGRTRSHVQYNTDSTNLGPRWWYLVLKRRFCRFSRRTVLRGCTHHVEASSFLSINLQLLRMRPAPWLPEIPFSIISHCFYLALGFFLFNRISQSLFGHQIYASES